MNKIIDNNRLRENYPSFAIPTSIYEIIFVNRDMKKEVMDKVLNHIHDCTQYSIDTESEMSNNQLALIQIHTIPRELPSLVILIELAQLPREESYTYVKITEMFQLIFRSKNELYSWGNMNVELKPVKDLFTWLILGDLINIQPHFPGWYDWARTQCRVQNLTHRIDVNRDVGNTTQNHLLSLSPCSCHRASPYESHQLWSLQQAFIYGCNLFIDKANTLNHWSSSLTSEHSPLPYARRQKMIKYATYDVMAVTYLAQPIIQRWTFKKMKKMNINEMFITFKSSKLPPL
ncbi:hypothetical protein NGRA_3359, partial [Nosema granulosis]